MARAETNVVRLSKEADRVISGPFRFLIGHPTARFTLLAITAVAAIAALLIPVRDSIGTANIGLALALVVGGAGAHAGFRSGLATAVAAGLAFTQLHAVPHGLPLIEEEQDALTAVLLLVTGAVTGWVHQRRAALTERVADDDTEVQRLHRLAEAVLGAPTVEAIMAVTSDTLRDELDLESCHWEAEPSAATDGLRALRHSGAIEGATPHAEGEELGRLLTEGATISTGERGRFVLVGRKGAAPAERHLRVALIMADLATAAAGLRSRPPTA